MNKYTNFEDTIFILNIQIRMIRDLLILDADPELFLEKTLGDVDFIDANLSMLLGNLEENERLIGREELFYSLYETERQFSEILSEMEQGNGGISGIRFPVIREKIAALREKTHERRRIIKSAAAKNDKKIPEPMGVSSVELCELLKD
jgi:hypothetical protein